MSSAACLHVPLCLLFSGAFSGISSSSSYSPSGPLGPALGDPTLYILPLSLTPTDLRHTRGTGKESVGAGAAGLAVHQRGIPHRRGHQHCLRHPRLQVQGHEGSPGEKGLGKASPWQACSFKAHPTRQAHPIGQEPKRGFVFLCFPRFFL